ncbi:tyrosine-type recombinase/integrase, partial [Aquimarina agarivorans]|uniref:tyrosine-type recombinase/integrase n=1 Tax=Aquimarina agarivorans TaxID=980584 RepID=UPI000248EAAF
DLEIIKQHPCPHLVLKDRVDQRVFVDTLYTKEELENFVHRQDQCMFKLRNQVIRQLLVYQGLSVSEIVNIEVQHIDLEKGSVILNDRSLKLKSQQTITIYKYQQELYPKLVKHNDETLFLLSRTGRQLDKEHINSMTNKGFTRKYKPRVIRQSVIYQLLQQGENLRSVQLFAGHRSILSTERYQKSNLEQLRGQLQLHHPLNDLG